MNAPKLAPLIVDLDSATAGYGGRRVLHDITLSIRVGERVAVVGKSGAGKSTLLSLIYKHVTQKSGTPATVLVPQALGLVHNLSVFHNIYMGRLAAHGPLANFRQLVWPSRREVAKVRRFAGRLDLENTLRTRVGALSGGQQQRVAIGRALFAGAQCIIADEPLSALDPERADLVLSNIVEHHRTVIVAIHDLDLALRFADRIIVVGAGRIQLDRAAANLSAEELVMSSRHDDGGHAD